MKLEEKILILRKKHGLSQEELAQRLGVTRQAVYKWESGNAFPEMDKVKALAKLFSVSFDYLLDDTVEEYDLGTSNTKVRYRDVYFLGDKQDPMQVDIDHGYIDSKRNYNAMNEPIFSQRKRAAENYIKKTGATEIHFFSEVETIAYFYNSDNQTIGFYYGCGIQFICPIENLVNINVNGGATNIVNSRSGMLGIGSNGVGIGSIPTVTVQGGHPINISVMYHDGDIVKNFSFNIMTSVYYLYFEHNKSYVETFNNILRQRVINQVENIKAKIDTLIYNSAVLVTEKTPDINPEYYRDLNARSKAEYLELVKKLKNEVAEEKNESKETWIKIAVWLIALLGTAIVPQLILIPLALLIGIIPANIAKHHGWKYISWWMYGSFVFPVAMIHLLYLLIKKKMVESENFTEERQKNLEIFERIAKVVLLFICVAGVIWFTVTAFIEDVAAGIFLLICQLLGLAVAFAARREGRNFVLWWIYGTFLLVIAIIHLAVISSEE